MVSKLQYTLGCTLVLFHFIFVLSIVILPFITNNLYILLTIIIINFGISVSWLFVGECILNRYENYLLGIPNPKDCDAKPKDGVAKPKDGVAKPKDGDKNVSLFKVAADLLCGEKNGGFILAIIPAFINIFCYVKIITILQSKNIKLFTL
jgi:hypothetical protein